MFVSHYLFQIVVSLRSKKCVALYAMEGIRIRIDIRHSRFANCELVLRYEKKTKSPQAIYCYNNSIWLIEFSLISRNGNYFLLFSSQTTKTRVGTAVNYGLCDIEKLTDEQKWEEKRNHR